MHTMVMMLDLMARAVMNMMVTMITTKTMNATVTTTMMMMKRKTLPVMLPLPRLLSVTSGIDLLVKVCMGRVIVPFM